MSATRKEVPQFRGAIIGYSKTEVDEYVMKTVSELENQGKLQEQWDHQIEELKKEIQRLNETLESEQEEKQHLNEILKSEQEEKKELLTKQNLLTEEAEQLREQSKNAAEKYDALRTEYDEYRSRMEADGADPKIIQDAILNAQRMSEIVIVEAQQKALDIREKAANEKKKTEEEGRKLIEDARTEAKRVTDEAALKCNNLQKEYDRILLDVTGFKSQLMKMYRKHMELLAAMPQKEIMEIEESKYGME